MYIRLHPTPRSCTRRLTTAYFMGRDYAIPEDIKGVAQSVAAHRVIFNEEYENLDKGEIIKSILADVPVPV